MRAFPQNKSPMIAELKNITKIYEQPGSTIKNPVINNISLRIASNESLAITGPSGSGKSTLLNILGTLDQPTSGIVMVDGNEVPREDASLAKLRNSFLGFVFQVHHLLPQLTLIENILLPALPNHHSTRKATHERALHLIERVGLLNQLHNKPSQLSVGECQRAAVVRALINQPRLLLADEPTGSLDASNTEQLAQLLVDLKNEQHFSMVVVTHSEELAGRMDKIYRLVSGKLSEIDRIK
jgi:lipoprotein-releasing system ATP-binding protein